MSNRMPKLEASVTDDQLEALKKLSAKTRVPMAVYVRRALDLLFEREGVDTEEMPW